ncbi:uncharacterized protein LOC578796 [Strongylocentrotus purpuratus]|uniref:Uncharacterized protein n=1 Tax=Strongylocentrotus purpuratus TaxID=7668 RepID=A0A7M7RHS9_STRPU|nr:uncharacterized protein LOC578796 [Strongylocentrotus purpuratus]
MESSSVTTCCLVWASMIAEAFGKSSNNQDSSDSRGVAVAAPALLIALAVSIMAVAALSIRALRRNQPAEITIHLGSASTTVDVDALGPPSLALDLDDDNVLDFEEEEEDEEAKEEAKTRRLGNLAQVMKSGRFFRANGMEELPYSPRSCRRLLASSSSETR